MRENLRQARISKGMTQKQVAEYLGISERYYQHIEAGRRNGDFKIWDCLEDLFLIHQRDLRVLPDSQSDKEDHQERHQKE